MSETAPETAPQEEGGGFKGVFTNRIGPLPMWVWLVIIAAVLIAWRIYANKTGSASSTAADTTSAADVPQFVNQTYVSDSPPVNTQQPPPVVTGVINRGFKPVPTPQPKQQLTRTWTAPTGGVSTLAQIAQRLTGTPDPGRLTPANDIARKWEAGPYKRNKHAKVPKGATFTYTEGTVTNKAGAA